MRLTLTCYRHGKGVWFAHVPTKLRLLLPNHTSRTTPPTRRLDPPNPSLMTKVETDTTVKASALHTYLQLSLLPNHTSPMAQLRRRLIPPVPSLIALTLACTRGGQNTCLGSGDEVVLLSNHTFPTTSPTRRLIPPNPSLTALALTCTRGEVVLLPNHTSPRTYEDASHPSHL